MLHFLVGTRAQLIKMGPLMRRCRERGLAYNLIRLAQHRATMVEMLEMFELPPEDFVLGERAEDISRAGDMARWSVRVLAEGWQRRGEIFRNDRNGVAIVHGDAPPVLIGALIARAAGLRVAHVEAGLRSFNWWHPFPEELTRVACWQLGLVDHYFCQDAAALRNVSKYRGQKIDTGGNTLWDALQFAISKPVPDGLEIPVEDYGVVTLHRFETLSRPARLLEAMEIVEEAALRCRLLFILHPPTLARLKSAGLLERLERNPRIELRPRYIYTDFIALIYRARFLISDGGSNQEECAYMGKPCLLLREETERSDGLGENAVLAGFERGAIREFLEHFESRIRPPQRLPESPTDRVLDALARYV